MALHLIFIHVLFIGYGVMTFFSFYGHLLRIFLHTQFLHTARNMNSLEFHLNSC